MVNFKPAVLSLNIKQVIMANRGLKSDKKPEECASFCLIRRTVRKIWVKESTIFIEVKTTNWPRCLHGNYSYLIVFLFLRYVRCVWPSTSEDVLVSGSSGISITVDSEKGSSSGLDIVSSKPSSKLSPELVKRLRDISGKYRSSGIIHVFRT